MELMERDGFLTALGSEFEDVSEGEGHSIFVSGEAGIGKTSLIKAFCNEVKNRSNIYQGICDALFTPRPLAPLYDVLLQLGRTIPEGNIDITNRTAFFTNFLQELNESNATNATRKKLFFFMFIFFKVKRVKNVFFVC